MTRRKRKVPGTASARATSARPPLSRERDARGAEPPDEQVALAREAEMDQHAADAARAERRRMISAGAQFSFIVAAAAAVYGFVRAAQADHRRASCTALCNLAPAYAGANRRAPDFELPTLDGARVALSSFRGKVVYLNFWTKSCAPCLEEMPALADLAKVANRRKDMVVVTVSTDDTADEARSALQVALGEPPPFVVLLDPDAEVVAGKFGTKLYPETWLIDRSGIIRARFDGPRDWSDAIALELGEKLAHGTPCPVEFAASSPRGPFASICTDDD